MAALLCGSWLLCCSALALWLKLPKSLCCVSESYERVAYDALAETACNAPLHSEQPSVPSSSVSSSSPTT